MTSSLPPTPERKVKLLLFLLSFITTFSIFYFVIDIIIIKFAFYAYKRKFILQPTKGVCAPNQQRCSWVLNPLALLFLPLLPWSSRCHFATVAAADSRSSSSRSHSISSQGWGKCSAIPTSYQIEQTNLPILVIFQCSMLPILVQWPASKGDWTACKDLSAWFLGITGLFVVFVFKHYNFSLSWGLFRFLFLKDVCLNVCQWIFTPQYVISIKLVNSFPVVVYFS